MQNFSQEKFHHTINYQLCLLKVQGSIFGVATHNKKGRQYLLPQVHVLPGYGQVLGVGIVWG